jgi:hypothetical protein
LFTSSLLAIVNTDESGKLSFSQEFEFSLKYRISCSDMHDNSLFKEYKLTKYMLSEIVVKAIFVVAYLERNCFTRDREYNYFQNLRPSSL